MQLLEMLPLLGGQSTQGLVKTGARGSLVHLPLEHLSLSLSSYLPLVCHSRKPIYRHMIPHLTSEPHIPTAADELGVTISFSED